MKLYKKIIIFILVVFFKTETVFSENDLFNVNNIQLEKKDKLNNNALANDAIKKGFSQLIKKILLKEDVNKLSDLSLSSIKQLVTYYQITNVLDEDKKEEFVNFSVTYDKDKLHDLFFKRGILYSEISDKELYILPIFLKESEIFVFNNNSFYKSWNDNYENDLIEFILPLENIEIIQKINAYKDNLMNLDVNKLFEEYSNKNLALILIEDSKASNKIYIKTVIQGKKVSKSFDVKKKKLLNEKFHEDIILEIQKELIDLVKSKNLIDIRTPSFLNVKLDIDKKSNLVELKSRIENIDSIENIYVQEFNKDYMNLRIKYLGKLEKIINLLRAKKIDLKLINEEWIIRTL